MKKVAILGATGHVGKSIINSAINDERYELFLFARSRERTDAFLTSIGAHPGIPVMGFSQFPDGEYDAVINCVGIGSPQKLKNELASIFAITEQFDGLVLNYLHRSPGTKYINISSGAAYGTDFSVPAGEETCARFSINNLSISEYYGIAKLNSEAKHRALPSLAIIDLRMFAFFSRFIDLQERFLLTEVIASIKSRNVLMTGPGDIMRDYVHPSDLMCVIDLIIEGGMLNTSFDLYSLQPTSKFELLEWFAEKHGLRYSVDDTHEPLSVTGVKSNYFSGSKKAAMLGYSPKYSSLEAVAMEAEAILSVE